MVMEVCLYEQVAPDKFVFSDQVKVNCYESVYSLL